MKPLSRILAATDLSAPSRHAASRAFSLAAETGAALTLTHVVNGRALDALRQLLGAQAASVEQRILDDARNRLSRLAEELGRAHGISAGVHLATGATLREIPDQADMMEADLVVLGSRGEDYLRPLLLGTISERLLRRTLRPMLVVKQTPHEPYSRVLVPVDFSPWSVAAAKLARAVAPRAELVLLHAFEAPFESKLQFAGVNEETLDRYRNSTKAEALRQMETITAEAGLAAGEVRLHAQHGDASEIILSQEQEQDCDLIVMGKHGQGVLEELLLGSVTKHILSESGGDVLVAGRPAGGI